MLGKKIVWGLIFIALGILFAGNAFDLWNFELFFDGWWTLFIIVPCAMGLFEKGFRTSSFIGLVIGVLLLLAAQDVLVWSMVGKLIIPIILIFIGLKIIFGKKFNCGIGKFDGVNKNGLPNYTAIFGSNEVNFPYQTFIGANITSIFGGVELNLKDAIINDDVVINVFTIFGATDIIVPPNVKVKISSIPIFGGVSNKSNSIALENAPTVYINATCIFAGAEIK